MYITRHNLIEICDKFLHNEIGCKEVTEFAWALITNDEVEWEDEIVAETLFEWDNEEINFKINKVNMQLCKERLTGGADALPEHNIWNTHIEKQKLICDKYHSKWSPINNKFNVGVSNNLMASPIYGLRHPSEKGTTGWFIWTGEYSEDEDFFSPICAEHLLQIRPQIIKYLGLNVGFRFLADGNGYEDVWYDEKLAHIN